MKNPNWTRDELILALELYMRAGRKQLDASHPEVIELSRLLNTLPIHSKLLRDREFRNPNGVSMKLGNFLSSDPEYEGAGLRRGNRLELEVWSEFADDAIRLTEVATAIRNTTLHLQLVDDSESIIDEEEFPEGRILTRLHRQRERNRGLVKKKKERVLALTGKLECEACGFDFAAFYGDLARGFAECHHRVPVSELHITNRTRLSDLAILCANCHRVIHRSRPMLKVDQLKAILESRSRKDVHK